MERKIIVAVPRVATGRLNKIEKSLVVFKHIQNFFLNFLLYDSAVDVCNIPLLLWRLEELQSDRITPTHAAGVYMVGTLTLRRRRINFSRLQP